MAKKSYPEYVMEILRQRANLEEDDTSKDEQLNLLEPKEAFGHILGWEIGEGWTHDIFKWLNDCGFDVKVKDD